MRFTLAWSTGWSPATRSYKRPSVSPKSSQKNGPLAVKAVKQAVTAGIGLDLKQGLAKEMELAMPVFMSKDAQEGPRAFKEKRPLIFKGE